MAKLLGLTTVAILLAAATMAPGATLVVDAGSKAAADTNAGTADKPFLTISAALKAVKPGDVVEVKAGIYRETVLMGATGVKDSPVTLKAAAGERVVVTGADVLAVSCPYEVSRFEDSLKVLGYDKKMVVRDVVEILAEALGD